LTSFFWQKYRPVRFQTLNFFCIFFVFMVTHFFYLTQKKTNASKKFTFLGEKIFWAFFFRKKIGRMTRPLDRNITITDIFRILLKKRKSKHLRNCGKIQWAKANSRKTQIWNQHPKWLEISFTTPFFRRVQTSVQS